MKPLVGSLFSGIEGMGLGLERAGFEIAWQVEIDDFCQKVLHKHWPQVPKWKDIKNVTGRELRTVDLICGGFPCQPVSYAGSQRAQADERWLWPEFARLIRILRPRYVLVENVSGLLNRGIEDVLGDLAASGYDAEWEGIPASAFGAPHERQRIWIVAYTDDYHTPERRECTITETESVGRRDNSRGSDDNAGWQKSVRRAGKFTSTSDSKSTSESNEQESNDESSFIPRTTTSDRIDERRDSTILESSVADTDSERCEEQWQSKPVFPQQFTAGCNSWWEVEPGLDRSSDGLSSGMDRNRGINGTTESIRSGTVLPDVWKTIDTKNIQWKTGGYEYIQKESILQSPMYDRSICQRCAIVRGWIQMESASLAPKILRELWENGETTRSSHRRKRAEQLIREYPDIVRQLSYYPSSPCSACWISGRWQNGINPTLDKIPRQMDRNKSLGNSVVPQCVEWIGKLIITHAGWNDG